MTITSMNESLSNGSSYVYKSHDALARYPKTSRRWRTRKSRREAIQVLFFLGRRPISSSHLAMVTMFCNSARYHNANFSRIFELDPGDSPPWCPTNKRDGKQERGKGGATVRDAMRLTRNEIVTLEQIPSHAAAAKSFSFGA